MLAAPSMMSLRSCGPMQQQQQNHHKSAQSDPTYQNQQQVILSHFFHAHSQPQLSHSCSQPFLASQPSTTPGGGGVTPLSGVPKRVHPHGRMISSSADKLTSMSYSHIASPSQQQQQQQQQQPQYENSMQLLSFHEQVKNMSPFVVSKCDVMSAAVTTPSNVTDPSDISIFASASYLKPQVGVQHCGESTRFSQVSGFVFVFSCTVFSFYYIGFFSSVHNTYFKAIKSFSYIDK